MLPVGRQRARRGVLGERDIWLLDPRSLVTHLDGHPYTSFWMACTTKSFHSDCIGEFGSIGLLPGHGSISLGGSLSPTSCRYLEHSTHDVVRSIGNWISTASRMTIALQTRPANMGDMHDRPLAIWATQRALHGEWARKLPPSWIP